MLSGYTAIVMETQGARRQKMCPEKERLLHLLKLASHELSSLLREVARLAGEEPDRAEELTQILTSARSLHTKARQDFIAHVVRHGCGRAAEINGSAATQN
jgi:hypothetical protein